MRRNILQNELLMQQRSVIAWSIAVAAVILVFSSLFSGFAQDAALLNEAMAKFPEGLRAAFGLGNTDMSTVLGYYGFLFLFVQICLAIQAAGYGFALVSVEEREWTADFLLAKPVSRAQILTSKLIAALISLTITNAVVWISTFAFLSLFSGGKSYAVTPLLLLLASIVVFQLFFLSVGLAVSLIVKRIRSVTPYSMGLGFGMYVLSAFSGLLGESVLENVTPFKHFDPNYILQHSAYDAPLALVSVSVIVVGLALSYVLYVRRDIPAVV